MLGLYEDQEMLMRRNSGYFFLFLTKGYSNSNVVAVCGSTATTYLVLRW